jgi:hypothetical protein
MQLVEVTEYSMKGGYEGFRRLYERRPDITALFTTSYDVTIGAVMAAQNMQIQIPEQLSFVGFDDILLTDVIRPKLTLVTQPMHRIGSAAANHLRKLMLGGGPGGKTYPGAQQAGAGRIGPAAGLRARGRRYSARSKAKRFTPARRAPVSGHIQGAPC